jgi:hypothetical protein
MIGCNREMGYAILNEAEHRPDDTPDRADFVTSLVSG